MGQCSNLNHIGCVECGSSFDLEEASCIGTTVYCPVCGRANNIEAFAIDGFQIKRMYENVDFYEEEEPYLNGYLTSTDEFSGDFYGNNEIAAECN